MQFRRNSSSGFTITELLLVFSVIVIISAIIIVALGESQERSRNVAKAAQIQEYRKAFELYYSANGSYPKYNDSESATVCLGDYSTDTCWENGTSIPVTSTIKDALVPRFMTRLPKVDAHTLGGEYVGMIYTHQNFGRTYTLQYFMEGRDRDCLISKATGSNLGPDTLCTFVKQQ